MHTSVFAGRSSGAVIERCSAEDALNPARHAASEAIDPPTRIHSGRAFAAGAGLRLFDTLVSARTLFWIGARIEQRSTRWSAFSAQPSLIGRTGLFIRDFGGNARHPERGPGGCESMHRPGPPRLRSSSVHSVALINNVVAANGELSFSVAREANRSYSNHSWIVLLATYTKEC